MTYSKTDHEASVDALQKRIDAQRQTIEALRAALEPVFQEIGDEEEVDAMEDNESVVVYLGRHECRAILEAVK